MAGIISESWLKWGLGTEKEPEPRPPELDMLAANDVTATTTRKDQERLGKRWLTMPVTPRTPMPRTNCPRRQDHLN